MTTIGNITYYPPGNDGRPVVPSNSVLEFLQEEWNSRYVQKPHIVSHNDGITAFRQNLNNYDLINVINGTPAQQLKPIGNWTYGNLIWRLQLDLYTTQGRDRLWQLQHEIMNISFRRLHDIPNFQRIAYEKFTEVHDQQANMWHGKIDLELVSNAVQLRDPLVLNNTVS